MTDTGSADARKNVFAGSLPAWGALILSIGVAIWNGGIITQSVNDIARRVSQLEADQREADRAEIDTAKQLARIEAKVDLMIAERGGVK